MSFHEGWSRGKPHNSPRANPTLPYEQKSFESVHNRKVAAPCMAGRNLIMPLPREWIQRDSSLGIRRWFMLHLLLFFLLYSLTMPTSCLCHYLPMKPHAYCTKNHCSESLKIRKFHFKYIMENNDNLESLIWNKIFLFIVIVIGMTI